MPRRAPLLVRIGVVADLLGCSGDTVRRTLCKAAGVRPVQMRGTGPWYLTPAHAARVAAVALGRTVDRSYRDAIRRRAEAQASSFGAVRTEYRTVRGPGGTGVETPASANARIPSPGPAPLHSFLPRSVS